MYKRGRCISSIDRYNALIDLEAEYATFCRDLAHALEDLVDADTEACDRVRRAIEAHDRGTLAKKMPVSLFPTAIPTSVLNFRGERRY